VYVAIPATPTAFTVSQANGQVALAWALSVAATSYKVNRSTDGVTFSIVATVTANSYLDTAVATGTLYYYNVVATGTGGDSGATGTLSAVPTESGELSLGEIRSRAQQRADRVNSQFVTTNEWNFFINQALFELYDLLVTAYEDYFAAVPIQFTTDGSQNLYDLPNGTLTFTNASTGASGYAAPPFYKLLGVDLGINTVNNAFVTVRKFNFIDRNKFLYPNSASTIYGVFNLQYRLLGNQIEFIPTPSANQPIRIWYIPRLTMLLQDTDTTTAGVSGWLQYVIVRAAKYALDKEESDTSKLDAELLFLKTRIEESAVNRDAGQPDTISDVRSAGGFWNGPNNGYKGGW
jgi:hypothetical protein